MSTLADKGGDPFVIKFMAVVGEMMGEDSLAGHLAPAGAGIRRRRRRRRHASTR